MNLLKVFDSISTDEKMIAMRDIILDQQEKIDRLQRAIVKLHDEIGCTYDKISPEHDMWVNEIGEIRKEIND